MTTRLVALIGSLRADSFNRAVFRSAVQIVGADVTLDEAPLHDVALYDGDVEAAGDPPAVTALKSAVGTADGLVIFTPEYNRSIPAVTKNAIDWLSRPHGASALTDTAVGIIAATPGRHDAAGVRAHLAEVVGATSTRLFATSLGISSVRHKLVDGEFADDDAVDALESWLTAFVGFVASTDQPV